VDPSGNLIPHAALTLTREASSVTVTPGTEANAGIFTMTVDGRNIGYNFTSSAAGFTPRTDRVLLYTDLHNGTLTIELQYAPATPLSVRVERYVAGGTNEPLTTARLTRNGYAVTPNVGGYFTFNANASNIGNVLEASHYGFASVQHTIVHTDLDYPRQTIVIVLGADGGYEDRDITVRVEDTSGNLIPHAALTLTHEASSVTVTPGTGANAGIFEMIVDGRNIGYNFTASAAGFITRTDRVLLYTDLHNGTLTIVLLYEVAPLSVRVERYVAGGTNEPLSTATLTRNGAPVTPNIGGTFTFDASGSNIDDILVASHYGFANVQRTILYSDLNAPRLIVMVLGADGGYEDRDITVRVQDTSGNLIPHATLTLTREASSVTVTPGTGANAGIFTMTVDGRNIGYNFTASAAGFTTRTDRVLLYTDVHNGTLTIVLQYADATPLSVRVERYVAGGTNEPLSTATLSSDNADKGITANGDGTFTFNANGYNIGDILTAGHYGFAPVSRTILYSDLNAPRLIVIVLGGPDNEYRDRHISVRVEDTSGNLIPHASLTLTREASSVTVTPGTGANAGTFTMTVDGRNIGYNFIASAAGFTTRTDRTLLYTDLHNGTLTIVLQYADATPLNVRVERYVAGGTNEPLSTATLSSDNADKTIIANGDGTFTFNANGYNIGDILTAGHYGFAPVSRTILYSDLNAPRLIVIVLGGPDNEYRDRNLTVRVEDQLGNLIPHASLTLTREASSVTVTPGTGTNAGIFTMTVTGENIGYNFTASALGFTTRTDVILRYIDVHNGTLTITLQYADAEPLNVRVERYVAGGTNEPLSTATLTLNNNPITPNVGGTFTFGANASHINQTLVASHYGFENVSHVITSEDLNAPRLIVIVLGDDSGYEPRDITVRVEDTSGNLIPHAALTLTREASSVTVTPGTGANAGIFAMTVDGRNIGYNFTASAAGFTTRTDRTLLYTDLHNGTLTIVLQYADATDLTVRVYSSNGNRLPTAVLTREGNNVPRGGTSPDYEFVIQANGSNIGDVLRASAYGFMPVYRNILHTDLVAPRVITIILGDTERDPDDPYDPGDCDEYDSRTFTVKVKEGSIEGDLIETATLVVHTGQVNPATTITADAPAGTFRVTADGRNVGDVLRASAVGFSGEGTHTIQYIDLAGGTVVIVLNRGGFNLSLANVPSAVTHTGYTATAGSTNLTIPSTNSVAFNTNVELTAGTITQNHYFLGWYRSGGETPEVGDLVAELGSRFIPAEDHNSHNFNMPAANTTYYALWGARGIVGAYNTRITFRAYGVSAFYVDGEYQDEIVVPVIFGQPLELYEVNAYLTDDVNEAAFAFWGWFTGEALDPDYTGRELRNGSRRPIVGTDGFTGSTLGVTTISLQFTAEEWDDLVEEGLVVDANIYLYAIWSLWGDVDDNDAVNVYDLEALAGFLRFAYPRPVINMAPADVHRDGAVNVYDLEALAGFLRFAYPRPVLGARPTN